MKSLEDMSLEELWELFPIELQKPSKKWKEYYNLEEKNLKTILKKYNFNIYHIGSTSIGTIYSKNIIDIILEFNNNINLDDIASILKNNGYIIMSKNDKRISLNKGYTINGYSKKVYHIHLRYNNDIDELYFKNHLINNPKIAKKYEKSKIKLAKKYKYNRDLYTLKKTKFVCKYTKKEKSSL